MPVLASLRMLAAAGAFASAAHASAIPVLLVDSSGVLTGANNVDVGGTLYNITFADGSCNSLFSNCSASSFAFTTSRAANMAARALLDQVFVEGPAGNFDTAIDKILGCASAAYCSTYIPYARLEPLFFAFARPVNFVEEDGNLVITGYTPFETDTTEASNLNYSIFQPGTPAASDVPEPGAGALIALAMVGLACARRPMPQAPSPR